MIKHFEILYFVTLAAQRQGLVVEEFHIHRAFNRLHHGAVLFLMMPVFVLMPDYLKIGRLLNYLESGGAWTRHIGVPSFTYFAVLKKFLVLIRQQNWIDNV